MTPTPTPTNYQAGVTLRTREAHLHLDWDGAISVTTPAQVIGVDGRALHPHAHTHRISPRDPLWVMAAQVVAAAVDAHHADLGIAPPPADARPIQLHPQGHPALPQGLGTPGDAAPLDAAGIAALRQHIVNATEAELSAEAGHGVPVVIPPEAYPLQEEA